MRTVQRLVSATVAFLFLSFTAFALPASAATSVANAPTSGIWETFHYPSPGSLGNPTRVHNVPLNVWQPLQYADCSQEVRIGYFYNYPYAEMRYVSGECTFGGISRTTVSTAGDLGGAGQILTSPHWDDPALSPGNTRQVCVVSGTQSGNSPCVQSGSGSIWNQQNPNTGAPRPILGANAVICGRLLIVVPPYRVCLAVNFGVF